MFVGESVCIEVEAVSIIPQAGWWGGLVGFVANSRQCGKKAPLALTLTAYWCGVIPGAGVGCVREGGVSEPSDGQ